MVAKINAGVSVILSGSSQSRRAQSKVFHHRKPGKAADYGEVLRRIRKV